MEMKTLSKQHQQLCSIDGIGTNIAAKIIVKTNAFRNFDNARSFSCYSGVAQFSYTSSSSIHSKTLLNLF